MFKMPSKRQRSKKDRQRFTLEGPSFVLCSLTMHELHNRNASIVSCMSTHNHHLYFATFYAGSTRKIARKTHNKELLTMVSDTPELSLSRSKISNPMIPELFYSRILNIKRGALHTKRFRCIPLSVFRYRLIKNGFADLNSFRGFRETGP